MKFSITIEIPRPVGKERQSGAETVKKAAKQLGKAAAKGFETAKKQIPKLRELADSISDEIKTDIAAVRDRDPAARNDAEVLLLYSGVHAILAYRVAHKLYLGKKYFPARAVSQLAKFITGIEIHPGATIGRGLVIDHGSGVVIGETAEIGDNCTLYQGVTLGGTGKDHGKRHPTLGDNVLVGCGAKILGPFHVGDNARVAAGAVVLDEVPPDSTAVGVPARIVRLNGVRPANLDQIHIGDPVSQQLCYMECEITRLQKQIEAARRKPAENPAAADENGAAGEKK